MDRYDQYSQAADFGALQSATNRLRFSAWQFLREFWQKHGKLHGLPKKVLYLSVIIAYCRFVHGQFSLGDFNRLGRDRP